MGGAIQGRSDSRGEAIQWAELFNGRSYSRAELFKGRSYSRAVGISSAKGFDYFLLNGTFIITVSPFPLALVILCMVHRSSRLSPSIMLPL